MQRFVLLAGLTVLLGTYRIAEARDSTILVCSGVAKSTDGQEATGVSIHYIDSRAADGTRRTMTLRELVGDRVFKASWTGNDDGKPAAITLKAGKLVRFKGTYALGKKGDAFEMHLVGDVARDPASDKKQHPIDVTLSCVDLSI